MTNLLSANFKVTNFIVVPEGLEYCDGKVTDKPSTAFCLVLERLSKIAKPEDHIFLAPANHFGGPLYEQEAAYNFLKDTVSSKIHVPKSNFENYLDTRHNALFLRDYLKQNNLWPLNNVKLVVLETHIKRANIVFAQEGFSFQSESVKRENHKFLHNVPRLFYYKYKSLHFLYEFISFWLFKLRIR